MNLDGKRERTGMFDRAQSWREIPFAPNLLLTVEEVYVSPDVYEDVLRVATPCPCPFCRNTAATATADRIAALAQALSDFEQVRLFCELRARVFAALPSPSMCERGLGSPRKPTVDVVTFDAEWIEDGRRINVRCPGAGETWVPQPLEEFDMTELENRVRESEERDVVGGRVDDVDEVDWSDGAEWDAKMGVGRGGGSRNGVAPTAQGLPPPRRGRVFLCLGCNTEIWHLQPADLFQVVYPLACYPEQGGCGHAGPAWKVLRIL